MSCSGVRVTEQDEEHDTPKSGAVSGHAAGTLPSHASFSSREHLADIPAE